MTNSRQIHLLLAKFCIVYLSGGSCHPAHSVPNFVTCMSAEDPTISDAPLFSFCPGGNVSVDYSLFSGERRPQSNIHGQLFGGIHVKEFTSLHWQGFLNTGAQTHPFYRSELVRDTDHLVVQIGKPALHKLGVSLGKQPPVFGVHTRLPSAFLNPFKPSWTRLNPGPGIRVGFDNLTSFSAELSVNKNKNSQDPDHEEKSIGARFINDIAAWSGTRLVLSLFGSQPGERRFGLGAMNIAPDGTLSLIEWVRMRNKPDGKSEPFNQLLRFYINGAIRRNRQTYFMYEDIRLTHRLGLLGNRIWFSKNYYINLSLAYRKDESSLQNHLWIFSIGGGINV